MADRSLSRPRPEGAAKSPPAASAGAPASVKAPAGVGAPAKATRADLALDRGRAAIVSLLACVVRARGRLSEADARTLCRHELPGKAFDLAQALAVDNGYLLALDGMCLVVTAAGRLLPGVMPPTARLVRMVEGASWEHPDGPPSATEAPIVYHISAGQDLLAGIPKGLVRAMVAGRVSGGELDRLSSAPREVVVSGGNVVARKVAAGPAPAKPAPATPAAPAFTLAPAAPRTARHARRPVAARKPAARTNPKRPRGGAHA
jgi:hypothetical protein